jgi:hypothetical protein
MWADLIAAIRAAVREWKRRTRIRKYRASVKNDTSIPF